MCRSAACVFSNSIRKLVDPTYNALELSACNGNFLHVTQNMFPSSLLYSTHGNKLRQCGMNLHFLCAVITLVIKLSFVHTFWSTGSLHKESPLL